MDTNSTLVARWRANQLLWDNIPVSTSPEIGHLPTQYLYW